MAVAGIDHCVIAISDWDRSNAFYRDVVGLAPSVYSDGEVETPNVTLSFWAPEADEEPFDANMAGIGLRVADVSSAVEEFRSAGGEVIGIEDSGVCHMGFVKDLDGNVLILHRRYAPKEKREQG